MPQWVISLIVGIVSGGATGIISSYLGVQLALARLETWKSIRDGNIDWLMVRAGIYNDDLTAHDLEIGQIMAHLNIARVVRQRLR
jgi:hypothetical protein